ncbi:GAF domain-containing protein [Chitinophaga sp. YR573]|uniref:GAF domain-containing protein n=1 Tax=Chitinophaga sp. YR573 TaxID=1881040 RepID=UPI0008B03788|nr:GAF domain-containing protein [Chitinophaga sp. YR573]SEV91805.1 GAF domain-containing protein [Chitinophaga sp. YR573]
MKKIILDLSGGVVEHLHANSTICFRPFIDYLRKRAEEEQTVKATLYENALSLFDSHNVYDQDIPVEEIHQYEVLLEQVYLCLSAPLASEDELAWGLGHPMQPVVFYGTSMLYDLMETRKDYHDISITPKTDEAHRREDLQMVYSLILKKVYNFQVPLNTGQFHGLKNMATGLHEYYGVQMNVDFIDVVVKGEKPDIDFKKLYTRLTDGAGYEILEDILPLDLFTFRGITAMMISDVTARMAVQNIQKVQMESNPGNEDERYKSVMLSLKTIVKNNNIEFDLFPFVKVNDEPVYGYVKGGTGVLFSVWGEDRLSIEDFQRQVKGYTANPRFFFSEDITAPEEQEHIFLEYFRKLGVRSLALMPVFYNHKLVGVLCVHTWEGHTFNEGILPLLEPAISAVEQLSQVYIDEFNWEIESIIKEQFTSIQTAVQWKFNEAAWNYLYSKKKGLPAKRAPICFNDVYPLYGAVDIRNSTVERNKAIIADLEGLLNTLLETLSVLQEFDHSALMEELVYKCGKWKEMLRQEQMNAADENNLTIFVKEDVIPYLTHLSKQDKNTTTIIDKYLLLSERNLQTNREALEMSMQMINNAVTEYFESQQETLQRPYPCYFEKFRTDGIEYDIYIGQSIAPDRPYDQFHLKNLRLWQLSSMAAIAKLTHGLLPEMPTPLQTTQLIFVHNNVINIGFRADERKFDVEGAYSIRYQMIKKRIDKVHVRNTEERLTQPDKIVLIYFDKADIHDYLPFIHYLQEKGILHNDLEELVLEDLQGLTGLKALRVGVVY